MGKLSHSFVCPNCGEPTPKNARACPNCGSDENTGWSSNTYLDGIDLPFEDDDYEEIRDREFSGKNGGSKNKFGVDWKMIVGAAVLAAMLLTFVFNK